MAETTTTQCEKCNDKGYTLDKPKGDFPYRGSTLCACPKGQQLETSISTTPSLYDVAKAADEAAAKLGLT